MVSSRLRRRSSVSSGARPSRSRDDDQALSVPFGRDCRAAVKRSARAVERGAQLGCVRHDQPGGRGRRRRTHVGREVAERVVLLVADCRHDRHGARRDGSHDAFVRERQQVFEAAAAARQHEHVDASPAQLADRLDDRSRRPRPLDVGLGDDDVRRREALNDVSEHVTLRRSIVSGDEADQPRKARQRPLPRRVEQPLGCECALQPLERHEVCAEPEALDRQRSQSQLAALLVQLRAAEDVHALAVGEREVECVEAGPLHLHRETRTVVGVLEREEHRGPALLPAQLRHLALDPDGRQAAQPRRDAFRERTDGVDLAPVDLGRLDLHGGDRSVRCERR